MKHKCKKCDSHMSAQTLLSSEEDTPIHEHYTCDKNPDHPDYCNTQKMWI